MLPRKRIIRTTAKALQHAAGIFRSLYSADRDCGGIDRHLVDSYGDKSQARVDLALFAMDKHLQDVREGRPVVVALTIEEAQGLDWAAGNTLDYIGEDEDWHNPKAHDARHRLGLALLRAEGRG